jgi:hypothetical protein
MHSAGKIARAFFCDWAAWAAVMPRREANFSANSWNKTAAFELISQEVFCGPNYRTNR